MSQDHEATSGKYRLLAELGQGGTAVVHLAVAYGPSGFNKLVVLKTLKRSLAQEQDLVKGFLSEARLAARLNHPNVVQTYEVVEEDGLPAIVMEYLEGQPLSLLRARARAELALGIHLRIIADALRGLHYVHEMSDFNGAALGIVHRDVTPQNLFVTFDGQIKILDFGIAKLAWANPETQEGVLKGKIRYMPPEQILGDVIDRRADIYAIGVMLWEAAAQEEMWKDVAEPTIMNRVLNAKIPAPSTVRPDVSKRLESICMKALSENPEQRYATAAELELELEAFLEQEVGTRSDPRSIGKLLSTVFAAERRETKLMVDAQLSRIAALTWEEYEATKAPVLPGPKLAAATRKTSLRALPGRSRKRGRALALALAGLLALALGLRSAASKPGPGSAAAPPPALSLPAATADALRTEKSHAEASGPTTVQVRFAASPPEAKLFFDHEPLPTNPVERRFPSDRLTHVVRAEAAGYQPASTSVSLEHDTAIVLALERVKRPAPRRRANPNPRSKTERTASVPNCDPPYYVDPDGTKKFKLECL